MMFFGGGMLIFWLLVLVGIIAAGVGLGGFAVRNRQDSSAAPGPLPTKERPEDILRARYARGEISREEYVQMQAALKA
jgi:putative membrane protein